MAEDGGRIVDNVDKEHYHVAEYGSGAELSTGHVVHLVKPNSGTIWDSAVDFESKIFDDRGYIENKDDLVVEYEKYLPHTSMMLNIKGDLAGGDIVACARIIDYSPSIGFRTLNDATEDLPEGMSLSISEEGWRLVRDIGEENMIEVATISGSGDSGAELYGAFGRLGIDMRPSRPWLIASLSNGAYNGAIKPLFGDAVTELGPTVEYYGVPTTPLIVNLIRGWDNISSLAVTVRDDAYYSGIFDRIAKARGTELA